MISSLSIKHEHLGSNDTDNESGINESDNLSNTYILCQQLHSEIENIINPLR